MALPITVFLLYLLYVVAIEWTAAIVGQRCKRAVWQDAYKWLVVFCWVTAIFETTCDGCYMLGIGYNGAYNVWAYFETGGIIYIQLRLLMHRWAKRLLTVMFIMLTAGAAINYIWGPPLAESNIPLLLFTLFIQMIAACAALIDILVSASDKSLSAQPAFWLNAGMVFYGSIFILTYVAQLFSRSIKDFGWYFIACSLVANTCMYGGFIAAFITLKKQPYVPENIPAVRDVAGGA
jgi:hypothetical protein